MNTVGMNMYEIEVKLPVNLELDTARLVTRFAEAMALKLYAAQEKYGRTVGWMNPEIVVDLQQDLANHFIKGDPLDVAAYCAFLWHHKASTC
jgi:hypothetical protein